MTRRVALTQSNGRLEGLAEKLAARGWEVVRNPLIATVPRTDDATREAAAALLELPWILFTSRSAVEAWNALGLELPDRTRSQPRIGAVGDKTASALAGSRAEVSLVPANATARGLAEAFTGRRDADGPVGLPQGSRARPALRASLERAGYPVRIVTVYDTLAQPWVVAGPVDAVVLASPSAVEALPQSVAESALLVTLGTTTSRAVRGRGYRPHEATAPSVEAVLETLTQEIA